jgi:hypothetical protein
VVESDRPQITIQYGACALYGERVMLQTTLRICNIYCFALHKWLHERVSMLRCAYCACLVTFGFLYKAAHHRRMVGLTVVVPQFENP